MRALYAVVFLVAGCNCLVPVTELEDGGTGGGSAGGAAGGSAGGAAGGSVAGGSGGSGGSAGGSAGGSGMTDGGRGLDDAGVCFTTPIPGANPPSWQTGSCPDAGCAPGTMCLQGYGEGANNTYGCMPVPAACKGTPTCGCMGCVCAFGCNDPLTGLPLCFNGTISRREYKQDVKYLSDADRAALAKEALSIRLARYRYKTESPDSRLRLGFMIDDQPDPSAAVFDDRKSVDPYGYTSMLLATLQQQQTELAELKKRLSALEASCGKH